LKVVCRHNREVQYREILHKQVYRVESVLDLERLEVALRVLRVLVVSVVRRERPDRVRAETDPVEP
jgi:hypothetical protein